MVSLMVVCAVALSLAFGVLVAYGLCQVMFRMFRFGAVQVSRVPVPAGSRPMKR